MADMPNRATAARSADAAGAASILPADLGFFSVLAGAGSLGRAARELGVTTSAVSRHLAQMEARLGLPLVNRTTRRMSLTPDGEVYLEHARRILEDIDGMADRLNAARSTPQGLLRVNATLGFGRRHVAPLIARFVRANPQVEVHLQLSVSPPPISDDAWDVAIRFGAPPDSRVIARWIAPNRRLLCASPDYLARRGQPRSPTDLLRHDCIDIRQGDDPRGVWRLTHDKGRRPIEQAIKTRGNLTTNDSEIAVNWALDGHGIVMRAEWDIDRYLASGRLVQVLPDFHTPDADVHAVYRQREPVPARIRVFVDAVARGLGGARRAR